MILKIHPEQDVVSETHCGRSGYRKHSAQPWSFAEISFPISQTLGLVLHWLSLMKDKMLPPV